MATIRSCSFSRVRARSSRGGKQAGTYHDLCDLPAFGARFPVRYGRGVLLSLDSVKLAPRGARERGINPARTIWAMFFGPRLKTIFASRWNALFWSACVLLTAYCTVPAADQARQQQAIKTEAKAVAGGTAAMVERRREAFERQQRLDRARR